MNSRCCNFLLWSNFRSLNNIIFLRVSYLILIGVPILTFVLDTPWGHYVASLPLTLRLGYFSSLLLSLAHMVFQGYCPQIIKRFVSPNDLYRDMLEIKSLQVQYLSQDKGFEFHIQHCRDSFNTANKENCLARGICALFYGLGLLLIAWVIIERSWRVFFN